MSDGLAQWLGEQIDEDERIAREAARAERADVWTTLPGSFGGVLDGTGSTSIAVGYGDVMAPETAAHIAAHDPARVLREIDAKRKLIRVVFEYEASIDGEWGCGHDAVAIRSGLCPETPPNDIPALRVLALPYADRPGYREEWAPGGG